jgi:hypothetical protein
VHRYHALQITVDLKKMQKIPNSISLEQLLFTLEGQSTLRIPKAAHSLGVSDTIAGRLKKRGRFYKAVITDESGKTTSHHTATRHLRLAADHLCSLGFSPGSWWHRGLIPKGTALRMQPFPHHSKTNRATARSEAKIKHD